MCFLFFLFVFFFFSLGAVVHTSEGTEREDESPQSWSLCWDDLKVAVNNKSRLFLGPPVVPFQPFLGEGSPTIIDHRKKGTLIRTSPLKDLVSDDSTQEVINMSGPCVS